MMGVVEHWYENGGGGRGGEYIGFVASGLSGDMIKIQVKSET